MKIKKIISTALFTTHLFIFSTSATFAQLSTDADLYTHEGEDIPTFSWILTLFQNILTSVITLVGLAAFVMLLVGAFVTLSSAGDPKAMERGQQIITNAIIGLVIAVMAGFTFQILGGILGMDLLTISLPDFN